MGGPSPAMDNRSATNKLSIQIDVNFKIHDSAIDTGGVGRSARDTKTGRQAGSVSFLVGAKLNAAEFAAVEADHAKGRLPL